MDALKRKFSLLRNHPKPTGDPSCPVDVARAKRIGCQIDVEASVLTTEDGDDDEDTPSSIDKIFQRKHGLISKGQHGEAASTPAADVIVGRQKMLQETSGYNMNDVFNTDETSYCLLQHQSITRSRVPG
ncbi:hypothetical protein H257_07748 [Aphanomyces astaci]|uniref:DUF6818 domain-containing protein n=1 Tax=Aphanomyces astaci TaxID=112090 RepID=W4GH06_APHAT|nr:hypothetical protein H257_07748 [Aphanomyces astaci]ETV78962.1 hypothetical protein H257_07748 [Aphanomyces astaci]|eukprot:XP_009831681.1 hypothetical protein H257_07748 [Aphanomyces astaci]